MSDIQTHRHLITAVPCARPGWPGVWDALRAAIDRRRIVGTAIPYELSVTWRLRDGGVWVVSSTFAPRGTP